MTNVVMKSKDKNEAEDCRERLQKLSVALKAGS